METMRADEFKSMKTLPKLSLLPWKIINSANISFKELLLSQRKPLTTFYWRSAHILFEILFSYNSLSLKVSLWWKYCVLLELSCSCCTISSSKVIFHFASSCTTPMIIVTFIFWWGHDAVNNHLLIACFLQKRN